MSVSGKTPHPQSTRFPALRLWAALVLLVSAAAAVRWDAAFVPPSAALGPFMAGWLLLSGWVCAQLAERAGLPRVTGYLLLGLITGPSLAGLLHLPITILDAPALDAIDLVDDIAIALIGLVAGCEIQFGSIRSLLRPTLRIIGSSLLVLVPAGAAVLWWVGSRAESATTGGALGGESSLGLWMGAAAAGLVLVANSPAITVALIREMGADGPLARLALAATILKDVVLTTAFTAALGASVALSQSAGSDGGSWEALTGVSVHLLGSLAVGAVIGPLLAVVAHRTPIRDDVLSLLAAVLVVAAATELHLSILLTALTAGLSAANAPFGNAARVAHATDRYLVPILCVAFPVLGARLDLAAAIALAPLVIGLACFRAGGMWLACRIALPRVAAPGTDSRAHTIVRRNLWMAFLPQAAFALALLSDFGQELGGSAWGTTMHTLLVGVVVVNALIGPVFLRIALRRDAACGASQ